MYNFTCQVQNLRDVTVFGNSLFVASWRDQQIIELDKFGQREPRIVGDHKEVFPLYVYHRLRQPDGIIFLK